MQPQQTQTDDEDDNGDIFSGNGDENQLHDDESDNTISDQEMLNNLKSFKAKCKKLKPPPVHDTISLKDPKSKVCGSFIVNAKVSIDSIFISPKNNKLMVSLIIEDKTAAIACNMFLEQAEVTFGCDITDLLSVWEKYVNEDELTDEEDLFFSKAMTNARLIGPTSDKYYNITMKVSKYEQTIYRNFVGFA